MSFLLSIDQGTSSTKTIIFDAQGMPVARGVEPLHTSYTDGGFAEQDPEGIYQNVLASVKKCMDDFIQKGNDVTTIKACGISNQRETFVVWNQKGEPLYNAVVWQCKRSIGICDELKDTPVERLIKQRTGLIIDPYFSGTKLMWLSRHVPAVQQAIANGNAFFGNIDTWLLYKLTNGKQCKTDHTNASRTMFFDLHTMQWDDEIIEALGLKGIQLPGLNPSAADFGETDFDGLLPHPIPVAGMIGDSHAAAFGEGCFEPGYAKATLGTGCSVLMNAGQKPVDSTTGMVTTICWSIAGRVDYALEGVIVSCGATIEWLKQQLGLFTNNNELEAMATAVADNNGVYLVPAFSGLGAPHWQMKARAVISGLGFDSDKNHVVRAALESIAYQVKDVITSMEADGGMPLQQLFTNGGITANGFVMQFLTDLIEKPVANITTSDVSALGAAYMAGLQVGLFRDIDHLKSLHVNKNIRQPTFDNPVVKRGYAGWQQAVANLVKSC